MQVYGGYGWTQVEIDGLPAKKIRLLCNGLNRIFVNFLLIGMNDQQLVKNCLKGKREAQHLLYERHAEYMMGVCYRYTKSISDAEDVLQEGFIKVFKNLHQFKSDGELGAWIRKIMVNTSINYLKQQSRSRLDLSFNELNLHPVSNDHPDINLTVKELAELIRQLPTGYQTIFNLHAIEGYTHVEIGELLGIHEGTSRSQYARARGLLIAWIKKNEVENKTIDYAQSRL
jgi:RNA polymerase sigma factor (sigma-70 family)